MSDDRQSPYVSASSMADSSPASTVGFEQHYYPAHMALPELSPYGSDYNHYFITGGLQTNLPTEHYYDRQDCITPLSQHSYADHPSNASDAGPSPLHANLELPTGLSVSSPAAFMTPSWTPEPMSHFEDQVALSTPVASPLSMHQYSNSNASSITIPAPPVRVFAPIAPAPAPAPSPAPQCHRPSLKRSMSRDDEVPITPGSKRKRSVSPVASNPAELNAEDELLLRLKDDEGLSWKEIQNRFHTDLHKMFQVPALQMRLKRLRERMREWTETDIQALRLAHEYWNDNKFEIISAKMLEFGANEKWSAKQCFKKWHEIAPQPEFFQPQQFQPTPTFKPVPFPSTFINGTPENFQQFITTSA